MPPPAKRLITPVRTIHGDRNAADRVWVYVARYEPGDGTEFAVKRIPVLGHDEHARSQVDDLRGVIASLRRAAPCPFVAAPTSVVFTGPFIHIPMPLYRGTLYHRRAGLARAADPTVPLPELLTYMRCVARGLDHLHKLQVVHGDVKPHNIFLFGDGLAAVGDFGIDWPPPLPTAPTTPRYSIEYVAPEMFREVSPLRKRTFASDQYSLAATYLELRTGTFAFDLYPDDLAHSITLITEGKPAVRIEAAAEREVVLKALSREPTDRFPSCEAFVTALVRATRTEEPEVSTRVAPPVAPAAPPDAGVVEPWRPSNRAIATLTGLGVGAVVAAAAWVFVSGKPPRQNWDGSGGAGADRREQSQGPPPGGYAPKTPATPASAGASAHPVRLRLEERGGKWERVTGGNVIRGGYGSYRFTVALADGKTFGDLDDNAVFSFGLVAADGTLSALEISAWGDPLNDRNCQFIVGKYGGGDAANVSLFGVRDHRRLDVEMEWRPDAMTCRCTGDAGARVCDVTFMPPDVAVPKAAPAGEPVRIGLWLHKVEQPAPDRSLEVVVSKLSYTPFATVTP